MASNYISDRDRQGHEQFARLAASASVMLSAIERCQTALEYAVHLSEAEVVTEDEMWALREKSQEALRSLQEIIGQS